MARAAVLGRLTWLTAEVVDVTVETPRVKTIAFDVPGWRGHRAGQHVDVRLTAEDGYQAQRSYSIASAPDDTRIELTVERIVFAGAGTVPRCPHCDNVLATIVRNDDRVWISFRGIRALEVTV
jgi:ferredoxin-NADP reductase